tara:strand:+ start:2410 stop:2928 length:519 start_codon:yes stop_codon:yes gene_type:complete
MIEFALWSEPANPGVERVYISGIKRLPRGVQLWLEHRPSRTPNYEFRSSTRDFGSSYDTLDQVKETMLYELKGAHRITLEQIDGFSFDIARHLAKTPTEPEKTEREPTAVAQAVDARKVFVLQAIEGVSRNKASVLLLRYGSIASIAASDINDLTTLGIDEPTAKRLLDVLN